MLSKSLRASFTALINEDYSISADTDRLRSFLKHALSKVDFSVATGIYVSKNQNLNIGKMVGYDNRILISDTNRTRYGRGLYL